MRGLFLLLGWLASSVAWALDYPVPDRPVSVDTDEVGGQSVLWVDWGAAGGARARDPELIQQEQESFRRFLRSPELKGELLAVEHLGQARELNLLRARMAAWHEEYMTREQATAFPRQDRLEQRVVPLPLWAWGTPMEMRRSMQILIFDDRDPAQRQWVLDQAHDPARLSFAICTGWRSGDDRDRFWKTHPVLGMHPVATDAFAQFYGVIAYPARIRFNADTMDVQEGLDQ